MLLSPFNFGVTHFPTFNTTSTYQENATFTQKNRNQPCQCGSGNKYKKCCKS